MIKGIYEKLKDNIIVNSDRLKELSPKITHRNTRRSQS